MEIFNMFLNASVVAIGAIGIFGIAYYAYKDLSSDVPIITNNAGKYPRALCRYERVDEKEYPILIFPDIETSKNLMLCATIDGHSSVSFDYVLNKTREASFGDDFNVLGYTHDEVNPMSFELYCRNQQIELFKDDDVGVCNKDGLQVRFVGKKVGTGNIQLIMGISSEHIERTDWLSTKEVQYIQTRINEHFGERANDGSVSKKEANNFVAAEYYAMIK